MEASELPALKRVRVLTENGKASNMSIQDHLKDIGQRAAALQRECDASDAFPSESFQRVIWALLLEIRPFLFLSSPDVVFRLPPNIAQYRTHDPQRDLNHARLGMRLYLAVLRITLGVPLAPLHGCLTLLSLMPVFADPQGSSASHCTRFIEGLKFLLLSLFRRDVAAFYALLDAVLDNNTGFGVFALSPQLADSHLWSSSACADAWTQCELHVDPSASALSELARILEVGNVSASGSESTDVVRALFRTRVLTRDIAEAARVVYGCCAAMGELAAASLSLQLPISQASVLVTLATGLLSVRLEVEGATKRARIESVEGNLYAESVVFHRAAGAVLCVLAEKEMLIPHVHGPQVLHCIIEYWSGLEEARLASQAPVWLRGLLSWIVSVTPAHSVDGIKGGPCSDASAWLASVFYQNNLLERALVVLLAATAETLAHTAPTEFTDSTGIATQQQEADDMQTLRGLFHLIEWAACLLDNSVCTDAGFSDNQTGNTPFLLSVLRVPIEEYVDALLSCRVPVRMWLSEPGMSVSVAHMLWRFFPVEVVETLIGNAVARAETSLSAAPVAVIKANALSALTCAASNREDTLQRRTLMAEGYTETVQRTMAAVLAQLTGSEENIAHDDTLLYIEALVTLLRFCEDPDTSRTIAQDLLRNVGDAFAASSLPSKVVLEHELLWVLLFSEATGKLIVSLPLLNGSGTGHGAVKVALRRALVVPKKMTASAGAIFSTLAWRVAGVGMGLHRRLRSAMKEAAFGDYLPTLSTPSGAAIPASFMTSASPAATKTEEAAVRLGLILIEADMLLKSACSCLKNLISLNSCTGLALMALPADTQEVLVHLLSALAHLGLDLVEVSHVLHVIHPNGGLQCTAGAAGLSQLPRGTSNAECIVDVDDDVEMKKEEEEVQVAEAPRMAQLADTCGGSLHGSGTLDSLGGIAPDGSNSSMQGDCVLAALATTQEQLLGILVQLIDAWGEAESSASIAYDATLATLCTCVAAVPTCTTADQLLSSTVAEHSSPVIRCGYGGLALRAVLLHRHPFALTENWEVEADSRDGSNRGSVSSKNTADWFTSCKDCQKAVLRLDMGRAALTGAWREYVPSHVQPLSALGDCLLPNASRIVGLSGTQNGSSFNVTLQFETEGRRVLAASHHIWEFPDAHAAIHATCLEATHGVLRALGWSAEELCRHDPMIVGSPYFTAVCQTEDVEPSDLVMRSLDVLLGPCVVESDSTGSTGRRMTRTPLEELLQAQLLPGIGFAPVMAYILFQYAGCPAKDQLARIATLQKEIKKELIELPQTVARALARIVLNIISLEADAQLTLWKQTAPNAAEPDVLPELNAVSFSVFSLALQQTVSLSEAQPTEAAILSAVSSPTQAHLASQSLVCTVFEVIDSIHSVMDVRKMRESALKFHSGGHSIVNEGSGAAVAATALVDSHVSLTTVRRWLLGIASFVQFLGPHATLIAAKLPAMLEACCVLPAVMENVCLVWYHLICNCAKEYVEEHAPAVVVDLVSVEQYNHLSPTSLALLAAAVRKLFDKTSGSAFWKSYFCVLGSTSTIMQKLSADVPDLAGTSTPLRKSQRRRTSPVRRGAAANIAAKEEEVKGALQGNNTERCCAATSGTAAAAEDVINGFLSVMESSSIKCKAVFVRALHRYLRTASPDRRLEISDAASVAPHLIPTLLRCARELDEDDTQHALRCVGIIGAIRPLPVSTAAPAGLVASSSGATIEGLSMSTASYEYHLDVDTVLHWRTLVCTLLNVYCPRALANTADAGMHDRAAYAVQELLRVCVIRERDINGGVALRDDEIVHIEELQRYSWWAELNPKSRRVLEGFTSTRYTTVVVQKSENRTPEYHKGMRYKTWLFAFFRNLSSRCRGSFGDTIASLRNVAKRDYALLIYLFPYLVVHLIELGDSTVWDDILKEIEVICSAAVATSTTAGDGAACMRLSLRSQSVLEGNPSGDAAHLVDEHLQFVLHLLEDVNHLRWAMLRIGRKLDTLRSDEATDETCLRLAECYREFLDRIPWYHRSLAAIEVGSNMRALRCLEGQRRFPKVADATAKIPLQRIFAALDDRDSSRSIHRLSHGLETKTAAFSLENNGDWQLALQSCELVLQHDPTSVPHQFTMLRCMRQLGQLHLMSRYAAAFLQSRRRTNGSTTLSASTSSAAARTAQNTAATLQNYANEAAWRLGEWGTISFDPDLPPSLAVPLMEWIDLLGTSTSSSGTVSAPFGVNSTIKKRPGSLLRVHAGAMLQRQKLTPFIRTACREGYAQGYPFVATLHALADIELAAELFAKAKRETPLLVLAGNWQRTCLQDLGSLLTARMSYTDATLEAREPLFSLHRGLYKALGLQSEVMNTWLQHAQLLRDGGFSEAALSAARQADFEDQETHPSYYTIVAELLHDMNTPMQAIEFAQEHFANEKLPNSVRAELQVLVTNWMLETGSQTPKEVIESYETALKLDTSENVHHHLALFYEKLYVQHSSTTPARTDPGEVTEQSLTNPIQCIELYALRAIEHFGLALLRGHKTVSVSLPRMLTLWLDSAKVLVEMTAPGSPGAVNAERLLKRLNTLIESFLLSSTPDKSIPPFVVVTALPQLLSRLGHRSQQVVMIVTRVVVYLMSYYPQQCLWMVLPIAFSKQSERAGIAKRDIIHAFSELKSGNKKHLENAFAIFTSLIEVCTCAASTFSNGAKLSKQPFIQRIERMLPIAQFIIPTMANLTPNMAVAGEGGEVFPGTPTFDHFDDRVQIMSSLQKPKRIWVHTNEGDMVSFLCKAKDEPRKDIRMMEIAALMNTLFLSDADARRRHFSLRRYAIAALTDDCAMIEWVNEIIPIRNVVSQCYGLDGTGVRISQVKAWYAKVENKALSKMQLFTNHILPASPPVLHQWFDMTFPNNQAWYQARNLFTQSTALWSIAGHIVGLGDRHGENLMVDTSRGELMHVDFACMFDKGETLEVPERVRFRLTQNMIDAMGVLGADGPFRAHCEIALRCQMRNKNAVMSIVETLQHDPLVEWSSRSSRSGAVDPKRLIGRVARRLNGFLDLFSIPSERDTLALNVEGQVSKLISHSSALENLSEMYIWWMAWI